MAAKAQIPVEAFPWIDHFRSGRFLALAAFGGMAPWHYLKGKVIAVSLRREVWQPRVVEMLVSEITCLNNGLKSRPRPGVPPRCARRQTGKSRCAGLR